MVMNEELEERIRGYARFRGGTLRERLGYGIHGIVYVMEDNKNLGRMAVKVHGAGAPYRRERRVYERLADLRLSSLRGFAIPRALRFDDEWLAIEMTIVAQPFVVDFAEAYLDGPPEFPEDVWVEWEAEKQEQFGGNWTTVSAILEEFRRRGIHLVDVNPGNISFRQGGA